MKWIKRLWNYLFGSKEVEQEQVVITIEDKEDKMVDVTCKENDMEVTVDGQEVTNEPVVAEVTTTEFKKALKAKKERPEPPKKRHMNRKMRLFLKSMGWKGKDGKVLPPRETPAQLWSAFEGLRTSKTRKDKKRAAFKRSFGK